MIVFKIFRLYIFCFDHLIYDDDCNVCNSVSACQIQLSGTLVLKNFPEYHPKRTVALRHCLFI